MHGGRDIKNIIALVGLIGKGQRLTGQFQVTQPHAERKDIHLSASVVDVILAAGLVASCAQYPRQRITVSRTAAVAHVQRPGRVGRDEFHHQPLPGAHLAGAKTHALPADLFG